ncbi:hypothetical protein VSR68_37060 [Paraburkholderia phymatum]|uniref:hypothetical protein n=1 Tax=Paraburkholderia phymatum TaxID=148447 RepID=UPI003177F176
MNQYTPTAATRMFKSFFGPFLGVSTAVIRDPDLDRFMDAALIARSILKRHPNADTCYALEMQLGLMVNLFMDAPLLSTKPLHQVQTILDAAEITGFALSVAAGNGRVSALN